MRTSLSSWLNLALVLGYALAFVLLYQVAELYWYPPAGLRFALLVLAPRRLFPWLVLGEVLFTISTNIDHVVLHGGLAILPFLVKPVLAASGPWLLRHCGLLVAPDRPEAMARLLGAMMLSSAGAAAATAFYPFALANAMSWPQLVLQLLLGDFVGMLLLVPLALMLFRFAPDRSVVHGWGREMGLVLVPSLLLFLGWQHQVPSNQLKLFGMILCVLPITYVAFRSGWRGTAIAFPLTSIAITLSGRLVPGIGPVMDLQMMLVAVGSVNLLLGAAVDALRTSQRELQIRNDGLTAANRNLDRLADELRESARRNMGLSEDIRRWVTAEVHDELGQNLTALQTHIKLIERNVGHPEYFLPVRGILQDMRGSVSGLLMQLRPAGLDEFGLAESLQRGPIRDLVEASGMVYRISIYEVGRRVGCLENDVQTAIYRIVQEAATNAVRHAQAGMFLIRLTLHEAGEATRVHLLVGDDGTGLDRVRTGGGGVGLLGIRDRVIALGGSLHLRSHPDGTWLRVRLLLPG